MISRGLRFVVVWTTLSFVLLMFGVHNAETFSFGDVDPNFPGALRSIVTPRTQTPDVSGAVGLHYYIQATNTSIAAYNKVTGLGVPAPLTGFFRIGLPGGTRCTTTPGALNEPGLIGQPQVHFDHMAGRWFIAAVASDDVDNGPYYLCVAMSSKDFPAPGTTVPGPLWNMYEIKIHDNYLPDEPKFGVWHDGIYMATDLVDVDNNGLARTPKGVLLAVFNRDDLTTGALLPRVAKKEFRESFGYSDLLPANLIGNPPPSDTPGYFATIQAPNRFVSWEFDVNWTNPDESTFDRNAAKITIVNSFDSPVGYLAEQFGSNEKLDIQGQKLMQPLQYRYNIGGEKQPTLWANHTVLLNDGTTGVRWYEIRNPDDAIPQVFQQGTFGGDGNNNGAGDGDFRWLGSLAVDGQGNLAIGYSRSDNDMFPTISQAGRFVDDPLGELRDEEDFVSGTGFQDQTPVGDDGEWGRYSHMSIDPYDDCNFWYTNQFYVNGNSRNWRTQISNFSLVDCDAINPGVNARLNLSPDGDQASFGGSGIFDVDISDDGQFVVFDSEASNLVEGDNNGKFDVFLHNRDVDGNGIYDEPGQVETIRISVNADGDEGNNDSGSGINGDKGGTTVSISGDGRFIAYTSYASNLVPGDNNGTADVFVYDRIEDETIQAGQVWGNLASDQPSVASVDGSCRVAFRSFATNFVPNDTNAVSDIFLYDCADDSTIRMSVDVFGRQAADPSYTPSISADGNEVAFASESPLTLVDRNSGESDIYLRELNGALPTQMVSTGLFGAANARAYAPSISGDGTQVVFASEATNLADDNGDSFNNDDNNGVADVFLRNIASFAVIRVSKTTLDTETNGESFHPEISSGGNFVVLESTAGNIVSGDTNGLRDLFLYDLSGTDPVKRITFDVNGGPTNGDSFWPAIDGNGQHVAYSSTAADIVSGDTNNLRDVFAFDRDAVPPLGPLLYIPQGEFGPVLAGEVISVPIRLDDRNSDTDYISSVAFTVELKEDSCLQFDPTDSDPTDGLLDSVNFNLPFGFVGTAEYNPDKLQLEITAYDPTSPLATIPSGSDIVSIDLRAECQPPVDGSQFVLVNFGKDPIATFGNTLGESVAGETQNGAVEVLYNPAGDCNRDGAVDAGDLAGIILEIFDGDGTLPADAPLGSFAGDPAGCNPNGDAQIDSGDISCVILIIFSGIDGIITCVGDASRMAQMPKLSDAEMAALHAAAEQGDLNRLLQDVLASTVMTAAKLQIGDVNAGADGHAVVPILLDSGESQIIAATFSIDYDETSLRFNAQDSNGDGTPDSIQVNAPAGYQVSVSHDATDSVGEIDIAIFTLDPTAPGLKTGNLVEINFHVIKNGADEESGFYAVAFSETPRPSLGSGSGGSIDIETIENGGIQIGSSRFDLFLPFLSIH